VGETFNRFWAANCTKMRLSVGLRPEPLGVAIALPTDPLAIIRGT